MRTTDEKLDKDKLKTFIMNYYGSMRKFSYILWYTYMHLAHIFNKKITKKYISDKIYTKMIDKFNEWFKVDNFTIKPTTTINKNYFYKK